MKLQPWAAMTAAFAAGSLAAVGLASASAPQKIPDSTTGVITACMVKKTGAVRFINAQAGKTCKKKEKKVTFNQTGPRGPSNGFVTNNTAVTPIDSALVPAGTAKNRVVERTLPAGSYLLTATTSVHRTDATSTEIKCELNATGGTLTTVPVIARTPQQFYDVPLAVTASYTNTAEGTVYLRCDPSGPAPLDEGEANGGTLTVTQVGTLTGP